MYELLAGFKKQRRTLPSQIEVAQRCGCCTQGSWAEARYDVLFFDPPYVESDPNHILSHAFGLAKPGAPLIWESGAALEVPEQIEDWQLISTDGMARRILPSTGATREVLRWA